MIDVKMLTRGFALATSMASTAGNPAFGGDPVHGIDPSECTQFLKAGEASQYGNEVAIGRDKHGNRIFNDTAYGDKFNPNALTAAYRDSSMWGEYVKVVMNDAETNEENNVIVKLNDNGPFANDKKGDPRVIDLTTGAADELGMDGVAQVKIYLCP